MSDVILNSKGPMDAIFSDPVSVLNHVWQGRHSAFWNASGGRGKNKNTDLRTSQSGFNIICLQRNQLLENDFLKSIFLDRFNLAIRQHYLDRNEGNFSEHLNFFVSKIKTASHS